MLSSRLTSWTTLITVRSSREDLRQYRLLNDCGKTEYMYLRNSINDSVLLPVYCQLSTAYCLLRTAYCLLRTAYCLLPAMMFLLIKFVMVGKSVYKERIETFWGNLSIGFTRTWADLFEAMRDTSIVDTCDSLRMEYSGLCSIPVIQADLDLVMETWDDHRIRKDTTQCHAGHPSFLVWLFWCIRLSCYEYAHHHELAEYLWGNDVSWFTSYGRFWWILRDCFGGDVDALPLKTTSAWFFLSVTKQHSFECTLWLNRIHTYSIHVR